MGSVILCQKEPFKPKKSDLGNLSDLEDSWRVLGGRTPSGIIRDWCWSLKETTKNPQILGRQLPPCPPARYPLSGTIKNQYLPLSGHSSYFCNGEVFWHFVLSTYTAFKDIQNTFPLPKHVPIAFIIRVRNVKTRSHCNCHPFATGTGFNVS